LDEGSLRKRGQPGAIPQTDDRGAIFETPGEEVGDDGSKGVQAVRHRDWVPRSDMKVSQ